VAVVREIFELFVKRRKGGTAIASMLNARGILTDLGRQWTLATVSGILKSEKYIGNNVWGRTSTRLKQTQRHVARDLWVRSDGVFEAIVDRAIFDRAQKIFRSRPVRMRKEQMLEGLRDLFRKQGHLTVEMITKAKGIPCGHSYMRHFGSMLDAYAQVGFMAKQYARIYKINLELKKLHALILAEVIAGIAQSGGRAECEKKGRLLTINDEFTAKISIVRCSRARRSGLPRWRVRFRTKLRADLTIVVRMDRENRLPLDYFLLPRAETGKDTLILRESNNRALDAFRSETLEPLYRMSGSASPELALW
jgi:hypothetical protein